jgi:predicted type IV restriction endonuclease
LLVDVKEKEPIRQLAHHCFGEGMKYEVLSNRATWMLSRAFEEGTIAGTRSLES